MAICNLDAATDAALCCRYLRRLVSHLKKFYVRNVQLRIPRKPQSTTSMSSIPHGSSEPSLLVSPLWSLELLCGILHSWPIFEVPPGPGLWSHAGLRPLVPNGTPNGPSSVAPPLVIPLEFLVVPALLPGSPPGLLIPYYPICPLLLFSFSFTLTFLVVVYISGRTCIFIL
jgi:hypothetical protein